MSCANGPAWSPSITTLSPSGRSARPIPTRCSSATGCRSTMTRRRCAPWPRYVDAIATNYNVDSGDGWIAHYFFDGLRKLSGGKPVLVSEWFFAARENRTGNRNNGHLMTVETQDERAAGAAAATVNFAAIPELVGAHWFMYYDHPKGGRPDGEDYDFGLVDINDQPYDRLTSALALANRRAPRIHAIAAVPLRETTTFAVPHAAISIGDRSLSGWPKPASLLPRLIASPGAVEFGEAYLSWSERGLAVATIGQDYFEPDLLAYDGPFPLVDAYRVEIGMDFGAGPQRFTLFFIPPRTKLHDHPPMNARLCAGPASIAIHRRLHPGWRRRSRLFRRRSAADHGGDGDPLVGARHQLTCAGYPVACRGRRHLLGSRALDVALRPRPRRRDGSPGGLARHAARQRPANDRTPAPAPCSRAGLTCVIPADRPLASRPPSANKRNR